MSTASDVVDMAPSLGPWRLLARLGLGSSGDVWEAIHERTGIVGAVKVMSVGHSRSAAWAFQREVLAIAALDHPHVIGVLDVGEVEHDSAWFAAGDPWLAMELCNDGTLQEVAAEAPSWPFVREVVRQLLSGLGHAHARGVVHRDLKPSNVLLSTREPDVRIADFGLARALDDDVTPRGNVPMGTPHYMAPEQVLGNWRDFGPWTDLYALGGIVWTLLCGGPPHGHQSGPEALFAHLSEPLPALRPRTPVPAGLDAWVRRLLARAPDHRYARAVDALQDLDDLHEASVLHVDPTEAPGPVDPPALCRHVVVPPDPPSTTSVYHAPSPRLLPHRRPPIVDRDLERTMLWAALREADRTGTPQGVLLHGPAGVGRTRLARWLVETAHETGSHVLTAPPGVGMPLARRLLLRHFRCQGMPRPEADTRLRRGLDALGVTLDPDDALEETLIAVCAVLQEERPVVIWLDDAHTDPDALPLAHQICRDGTGRLLILTGVSAATGPRTAQWTARMLECERARAIELKPLAESDHRALVRSIAWLEPTLEDEVVNHTLGSPAFAAELLREWAELGQLVQERDGLHRRPDGPATPQSLHALWHARAARRLPALDPGLQVALRTLATFGPAMPLDTWAALCHGLTLDADQARERLSDLGCVQCSLGSVAAKPPPFRRALLALVARDADRARVHGLCADLLTGSAVPVRRGSHLLLAGRGAEAIAALLDPIEHVGRPIETTLRRCLEAFLLERSDLAWGWLALVDAAVAASRDDALGARAALAELGRSSRAQRAWASWLQARVDVGLGQPQAALEGLHLCEGVVPAARIELVHAQAHLGLGDPGAAIVHARAALADPDIGAAVRSAAHVVCARSFWVRGLLSRARREALQALTASEEAGGLAAPRAALILGEVLLAQGHRPAAMQRLHSVTRCSAPALRARAHLGLAAILLQEGDVEEAHKHLRRARGPTLARHRALARAALACAREAWPEVTRNLDAVRTAGGVPDPTGASLATLVGDAALRLGAGPLATHAWDLANRWLQECPSSTPVPEPPPA